VNSEPTGRTGEILASLGQEKPPKPECNLRFFNRAQCLFIEAIKFPKPRLRPMTFAELAPSCAVPLAAS